MLALALLLPRPAAAAWPTDSTVNVPLCTAQSHQDYPEIVSDGAGGAIVTWYDLRSGTDEDVYAQRISADGTPQWTTNGVPLCTTTGMQLYPQIVSDGAGGAIVAWVDRRDNHSDIYAQRISAAGAVQWGPDGVPLCTLTSDLSRTPGIVSDGAGGAIVAWVDQRSGNNDIYAQRISTDGTPEWTANGVALCIATGDQDSPVIASDGAGGAFVAWEDYRSGISNSDIYAQRVSTAGVVQWAVGGMALCTDDHHQAQPEIASGDPGVAIVAWTDDRSGNDDIYAQRISAAGAVQWTPDGVAFCTAAGDQYAQRIVSDDANGAVIAWEDVRSGLPKIFAQRVSAAGTVQWTADGVALCLPSPYVQERPEITSDDAGGAIVAWYDHRRNANNSDLYAQRVSAAGVVHWAAAGIALCSRNGIRVNPAITSDGRGGAIATWSDWRTGLGGAYDIYAQRVDGSGLLGDLQPTDVPGSAVLTLALEPIRPNPTRGGVLTVHFVLPSGTAASLELLDVAGRRIASREVGALGAGRHTLGLGEGLHLAPGLYMVRLTQGANTQMARVVVLR